jgi:hypothetical protein
VSDIRTLLKDSTSKDFPVRGVVVFWKKHEATRSFVSFVRPTEKGSRSSSRDRQNSGKESKGGDVHDDSADDSSKQFARALI